MENVLLAVADKAMELPDEVLDNDKMTLIAEGVTSIIENFTSILRISLTVKDPTQIGNLNVKTKDLLMNWLSNITLSVGNLCFLNQTDVSYFDDSYIMEFVNEFDDLTLHDTVLTCFQGINYAIYVNDVQYEEIPLEDEVGGEEMTQEQAEARFDIDDPMQDVPVEEEASEVDSNLATVLACVHILARLFKLDLLYIKQRCMVKLGNDA